MTFPAIAASLMAADLACLGDEIRAMTDAGIDAFHWDIMDGHFVPNLTFSPDHVKQTRGLTPTYFDVHLLVTNPEQWIDALAQAGADAISFHVEATTDHKTLIDRIQAHDMDAGLVFNPETDLSVVVPEILSSIDRLIIMTVNPGFGGQGFIDQTKKIQAVAVLKEQHPHLQIVVDGGINDQTAPNAWQAGATTLISGSYLFKHKKNYEGAIASLRGEQE